MSKVKIQGNPLGTGTLTIAAPNTNSDATINLPTVTGGEFIVSNASGNVGIGTSSPTQPLDVNGNIAITGNARRITGDFTNATVANRVMFQSSVVNANTIVGVIPNGTATVSTLDAYASSDPGNTNFARIQASTVGALFISGKTGTGTDLPMTFYTGGSERMRIATDGQQSSVIPGGSTLYPEFKCRAWVNFNGTTSPGTIRASGNVSSVTRNNTGDYTVNFTTAMPDADFSVLLATGNHTSLTANANQAGYINTPDSFSVRIQTFDDAGQATTRENCNYVCVSIFR